MRPQVPLQQRPAFALFTCGTVATITLHQQTIAGQRAAIATKQEQTLSEQQTIGNRQYIYIYIWEYVSHPYTYVHICPGSQ